MGQGLGFLDRLFRDRYCLLRKALKPQGACKGYSSPIAIVETETESVGTVRRGDRHESCLQMGMCTQRASL